MFEPPPHDANDDKDQPPSSVASHGQSTALEPHTTAHTEAHPGHTESHPPHTESHPGHSEDHAGHTDAHEPTNDAHTASPNKFIFRQRATETMDTNATASKEPFINNVVSTVKARRNINLI